jgi:hypothetical protein
MLYGSCPGENRTIALVRCLNSVLKFHFIDQPLSGKKLENIGPAFAIWLAHAGELPGHGVGSGFNTKQVDHATLQCRYPEWLRGGSASSVRTARFRQTAPFRKLRPVHTCFDSSRNFKQPPSKILRSGNRLARPIPEHSKHKLGNTRTAAPLFRD